jgi:hypothetical protein
LEKVGLHLNLLHLIPFGAAASQLHCADNQGEAQYGRSHAVLRKGRITLGDETKEGQRLPMRADDHLPCDSRPLVWGDHW